MYSCRLHKFVSYFHVVYKVDIFYLWLYIATLVHLCTALKLISYLFTISYHKLFTYIIYIIHWIQAISVTVKCEVLKLEFFSQESGFHKWKSNAYCGLLQFAV